MPTQAAKEHEDRISKLFIDFLIENLNSYSVTDIGCPENENDKSRYPIPLTVDGVFSIGGPKGSKQKWAFDITENAWNSRLIPTVQDFEFKLIQLAKEMSEELRVNLSIGYIPPIDDSDKGNSYLSKIKADIMDQATGVRNYSRFRDGTILIVDQDPDFIMEPTIAPFLSQNAQVSIEITNNQKRSVKKKLTNQLVRARDCGYKTILILDSVGANIYGGNFISTKYSYAQFIDDLIKEMTECGCDYSIDSAYLFKGETFEHCFGESFKDG